MQTLGLSLLNYASPTDAKPTGSIIVEVHYGFKYSSTFVLIVFFGSVIGLLILVEVICGAIRVSIFVLSFIVIMHMCAYHLSLLMLLLSSLACIPAVQTSNSSGYALMQGGI